MRLPETLALIDGDTGYSTALCSHLAGLIIQVRQFQDSSDLIADPEAFGFGFYVLDLAPAGIDGIEMIRILRRRTSAGIIVVSDRLTADVCDAAVIAGADMYLAKPVQHEQVVHAILAVHRRAASAPVAQDHWTLDRRTGQLITPDGQRILLSNADFAMLECFAEADGATVSRETLRSRLGSLTPEDSGNPLPAAIYRLRSRIERVASKNVPLRSHQRVGYVFLAPLRSV